MEVDHVDPQLPDTLRASAANVQDIGNDIAAQATSLQPVERWSKTPKSRGRQPRDPDAQSLRFDCRDIEDLETSLGSYLAEPTAPAEHTTLEFVYPVSAAFMVYAHQFKQQKKSNQPGEKEHLYGKLDRVAVSVIDALSASGDQKDQMRRQRAIAKICVEACEKVDGYRYSFHNNWLSREDAACRFSYFCNDSTLNKGRAANEGAGTAGKKMRKPVYDCQGIIAVKFSVTKQNLEVHYKHVPLHKTYAERAPPPRKDSKRRKLMAVFHPEELPQKRKSGFTEEINDRPRKRTASESASINPTESPVDLTQDGLQPLVAFLDSVEDPPRASRPEAPEREGIVEEMQPRRTVGRPRKSAPPGMLVQTLDELSGRSPKRPKSQGKNKGQTAVATAPSRPANSGIDANNTGISLSDLVALKAKLEEAEERIRKLEAEKSQPPQLQYAPAPAPPALSVPAVAPASAPAPVASSISPPAGWPHPPYYSPPQYPAYPYLPQTYNYHQPGTQPAPAPAPAHPPHSQRPTATQDYRSHQGTGIHSMSRPTDSRIQQAGEKTRSKTGIGGVRGFVSYNTPSHRSSHIDPRAEPAVSEHPGSETPNRVSQEVSLRAARNAIGMSASRTMPVIPQDRQSSSRVTQSPATTMSTVMLPSLSVSTQSQSQAQAAQNLQNLMQQHASSLHSSYRPSTDTSRVGPSSSSTESAVPTSSHRQTGGIGGGTNGGGGVQLRGIRHVSFDGKGRRNQEKARFSNKR